MWERSWNCLKLAVWVAGSMLRHGHELWQLWGESFHFWMNQWNQEHYTNIRPKGLHCYSLLTFGNLEILWSLESSEAHQMRELLRAMSAEGRMSWTWQTSTQEVCPGVISFSFIREQYFPKCFLAHENMKHVVNAYPPTICVW